MEASDGVIRGNVDSLMKLVSALENAGIELINPGVTSSAGGRGRSPQGARYEAKDEEREAVRPSLLRTPERTR